MIKETHEFKLAIVGLGYVGLPLAVEFEVNGAINYDLKKSRVTELQAVSIIPVKLPLKSWWLQNI